MGHGATARSGGTAKARREQVPTSFGGSEPIGARIFLFQLAGPTGIPVNRWAGQCSRALLTNHHCQGGAEVSDVWAGWRRKFDSSHSPACARSCLPRPLVAFKRGGLLRLPYFSTGLRSRNWQHLSRVFIDERLQSWKETSRSASGGGEPAD